MKEVVCAIKAGDIAVLAGAGFCLYDAKKGKCLGTLCVPGYDLMEADASDGLFLKFEKGGSALEIS